MKIAVDYFKKSGKYYMEEHIQIPSHWMKSFNEVKNNKGLLPNFQYNFRQWFQDEIQHDEFIAVVSVDFENKPTIGDMLAYPMLVQPKK